MCTFQHVTGEQYVCPRCSRTAMIHVAGVARRQCRPSPVLAAKANRNLPCVHLGESIGWRRCPTCSGNVRLKLYTCPLHGEVTARDCAACPDYARFGPTRTVRVPLPEHCYNASIFEDGGRLRLCWRKHWAGSSLWIGDLDDDYRPTSATRLRAIHKLCRAGREDPRVFRWRDRWHVAFSGVQLAGGQTIVHQMVARLDASGNRIEEVWYPEYAARTFWEKNFGWLEHDRGLYAVYTISPHIVLCWDGVAMERVAEVAWSPKWSGGALRGGAAPVRVGDVYYSFFHGVLEEPGRRPYKTYTLGVYTFEAKPPFRPLKISPDPILWPPTEGWFEELSVSVVFPCGAVLRGDKWLVSYGLHDKHIEIAEFDAARLERCLIPA